MPSAVNPPATNGVAVASSTPAYAETAIIEISAHARDSAGCHHRVRMIENVISTAHAAAIISGR